MSSTSRRATSMRRWLLSIGAAVAVFAQAGMVVAPIAEGREGPDAAAHVEASGISTHYAHNDATCAACQARTLHGLAARGPAPLLRPVTHGERIVSARSDRVTIVAFSPNNPRAPPVILSI